MPTRLSREPHLWRRRGAGALSKAFGLETREIEEIGQGLELLGSRQRRERRGKFGYVGVRLGRLLLRDGVRTGRRLGLRQRDHLFEKLY
jgi:hypothetical protein